MVTWIFLWNKPSLFVDSGIFNELLSLWQGKWRWQYTGPWPSRHSWKSTGMLSKTPKTLPWSFASGYIQRRTLFLSFWAVLGLELLCGFSDIKKLMLHLWSDFNCTFHIPPAGEPKEARFDPQCGGHGAGRPRWRGR